MIYFITTSKLKHVKIGYSKHPEERLKQIQAMCPIKLNLYATMEGGYKTEAGFHEVFNKQRLHGEWFLCSPLMQEALRALKQQPKNASGVPFLINDIKSFQLAGQHLGVRKANNRKKKRGKTKLNERIRKIKGLPKYKGDRKLK